MVESNTATERENMQAGTLFQVTTIDAQAARYVARHAEAVAMIHDGIDGLIAAQVALAANAAADMEEAWPHAVDPGAGELTEEGETAMARWDAARIRCETASRAADYMIARR